VGASVTVAVGVGVDDGSGVGEAVGVDVGARVCVAVGAGVGVFVEVERLAAVSEALAGRLVAWVVSAAAATRMGVGEELPTPRGVA